MTSWQISAPATITSTRPGSSPAIRLRCSYGSVLSRGPASDIPVTQDAWWVTSGSYTGMPVLSTASWATVPATPINGVPAGTSSS